MSFRRADEGLSYPFLGDQSRQEHFLNTLTKQMAVNPQSPFGPSIAAQWIDAALGAIRKELPAPTIITRKLHLLAASIMMLSQHSTLL